MKETKADIRDVMSRFATGVTVVAASDPQSGTPHGMTANAVCSVSLDPPLILVCASRQGQTHDVIRRARHFSVSVLAEKQRQVSTIFSQAARADKFSQVAYSMGRTGAPILRDALAHLECDLWAGYPGGDHTIFVGRVVSANNNKDCDLPLVFYGGSYESLDVDVPASVFET